MGLLDGNLDDPQKQMLMALAAGLLSPQGGKNFGANVGSAIPQGLLAYNHARAFQSREQDAEQQRQMHAMQLAQMQRQAGQQQQIDALAPKFFNPGGSLTPNDDMGNPMPQAPATFDQKGYANALMPIKPELGMQFMPKPNVHTLSEGAKAIDFDTGKTIADNPKPEGPKIGQVREVMAGTKTLQYEWDGKAWKKIGEGPRFKEEPPEKPQLYDSPTGPVWIAPPGRGAATQPVMGPDGKPIDAKKRDQPLTEAQGNATAYAMRAQQSEQMLRDIEKAGHNPAAFPGVRNRMAGGPLNVLASDQAQQYNAAKQNFVTAVLRKESGAAISQSEFDKEDQKYFPQPGDGPAVRAQKQKARELAIEVLKVQAGPGAKHSGGASGGWSIKPIN